MRWTRSLALLGTAGLALAGCEAKGPEPSATEAAAATPENAPGMALGDARVQLPAVPGRPGVAYFTVSQANGAPRKLVAVHVDGAGRAEMHRTGQANGVSTMTPVAQVPLTPGKSVKFAPGGYHVMLFDLAPELLAARQAELTVTFDSGDKASVIAAVGPVGEAMEARR